MKIPPTVLFAILGKLFQVIHSTVFWATAFIIVFMWWIIAPIVAILTPRNKDKIYFNGAKYWGKILLKISGIKVEITGMENISLDKTYIFASNHQSHIDYLLLLAKLPLTFRFVAKRELFKVPFFGKCLKHLGLLPIDRQLKKSAYNTMMDVIDVINQKESILIFPEGTRTWNGKLGKFKRGSLFAAFKTNVPIIPIAISGSFDIMRRGTWLIHPQPVILKIGKALSFGEFKEMNKENYKKAMGKIKNSILQMIPALRAEND